MLENVTLGYSSDTTIELIFHPGNHQLSSILEIVDKDYFSINSMKDTKQTNIVCKNDSGGGILLANINLTEISNIVFLGCPHIAVINVTTFIVRNCAFINYFKRGGNSFLDATLKIYSFQEGTIITSIRERAILTFNDSVVVIEQTDFTSNRGNIVSCTARHKTIITITNCTFSNNSVEATVYSTSTLSALIHIMNSNLTMEGTTFEKNDGEMIIYARESNVNIHNSEVSSNFADKCILCFVKTQVYFRDVMLTNNTGYFSLVHLLKAGVQILDGLHFSHNFGSFLIMSSHVEFTGYNLLSNSTQKYYDTYNESHLRAGGTLTVIRSTVVFHGNTRFLENSSEKSGGAIYASQSKVTIVGNISITNNLAHKNGGGAFLYLTNFICRGNCTFSENTAYERGGAIYAVGTLISVSYSDENDYEVSLMLIGNEAEKGGGLYFEANSKLTGTASGYSGYDIGFIQNRAKKDGGAIYVEDTTYLGICKSKSYLKYKIETECFFQALYNDISIKRNGKKYQIKFINNTAGRGSMLYGGLLDRCTVNPMAGIYNSDLYTTTANETIDGLTYFLEEVRPNLENITNKIASDAVRICFCHNASYDCSFTQPNITTQKSKEFTLTVVVVDQVNCTIGGYICSSLPEGSSLGEGQQLQNVSKQCTNLTFNISSPHSSEELILYTDPSPCRRSGLSFLSIKVNFTECKCSIGFRQTNRSNKCECECDPLLQPYVTVNDFTSFVRKTNTWINYTLNAQGGGYLYIIHPNCPYDYCLPPSPTTGIINLNLPNGADAQCNFNRAGLLCGRCRQGYSMSAGSLNCIKCPKQWPGLVVVNVLLGFISGIVLIMLFLFLNLTVAVGTVNGIIFYANVVLMNRSVFMPFFKQKLVVFLYLLNTQLGINRCVYEGMDAYGNVWLSLLFPLYLICLVLVIIVITKYSSRCAQLIGDRNPVATLATLVLISYAYFLRIILEIFSFTTIKYPNRTSETVWLSDASVKYLQGKHIPIFLTGLTLFIIGIAYTLVMFLWQWLLHMSNITMFKWVKNTKLYGFIEAYHAPFKPKYRFWTGLLLFLRILLNILITANVSGNPQYNLLTTGTIITLLIMLKMYIGNKVYKHKTLDYVENVCYFNLLFLTMATFYTQPINEQETSTNVSISVTLVLFLCILMYHIHYALCSFKWYRKMSDWTTTKVKHRHDVDETSSITNLKLNNKLLECSSTEVTFSNSTLTEPDDKFQCTCKLTRSQTITENHTCTCNSHTLREPLLQDI